MAGPHRLSTALTALALGLLTAGCPKSTEGLELYPRFTPDPSYATPGPEKVEVRYLGVGGYYVRRGKDSLLFAPSFTNPPIWAMSPANAIEADTGLIDRCLKKALTEDELKGVEFILVGHAHYDHLMDVPWVMRRHAPKAIALGSRTMRHTLAGAGLARRTLVVDGCAAPRSGAMGRWIYNRERTVRVLAIESEHSPHFWIFKLMTGHYTVDRTTLPRTGSGWKEGQTYAYLVDFLDKDTGRVDFRIHFQDAASREGYGFVPPAAKEGHPRVDLAITCVGAHASVEDYPGPFLRDAKPRHIVLGHWEDFFGNQQCGEEQDPEPLVARLAEPTRFLSLVKDTAPDVPQFMPYPYSTLHFPRAPEEAGDVRASAEACPTRPGELPELSTPVESVLDATPRF